MLFRSNCTFANYYLFNAIGGPIVSLNSIYLGDTSGVDDMDATFDNCILYGNTSELNIGDFAGTNIYFRNCLLKSKGDDDSNFINCKWGSDPKFYTVRNDYIFDYRIKNESDAIGAGDNAYCPSLARYDRYGNDRFLNGNVDLGAYVWIEEVKE